MSLFLKRNTELHRAIETNNEEKVKQLLAQEANINFTNSEGYTSLHLSALYQSPQILDLILSQTYMQVDTKAKTRVGDSALFLILMEYNVSTSAASVSMLLAHDRDLAEMADASGLSPLMAVCRWGYLDIARCLVVEGKVNPNRLDERHWNALFHNVNARPNAQIIRYLIDEVGIDIYAKDRRNRTAFDILLNNDHPAFLLPEDFGACVDLLMPLYLKSPEHYTFGTIMKLFKHAITFDRPDIIKYLVNEFYLVKSNTRRETIKKFIKAYDMEKNRKLYNVVMFLNDRYIDLNEHFEPFDFFASICLCLMEALPSEEKTGAILEVLTATSDIDKTKRVLARFFENIEFTPTSIAESRRLYSIHDRLLNLDFKVDFNGIAVELILRYLSSDLEELNQFLKVKHLNAVLAFCTDNFVILSRLYQVINRKLELIGPLLPLGIEVPREMGSLKMGIPKLTEMCRKTIRAAIFDGLLQEARQQGLPVSEFYKNKKFVNYILDLEIPEVLKRYLRYVDDLV